MRGVAAAEGTQLHSTAYSALRNENDQGSWHSIHDHMVFCCGPRNIHARASCLTRGKPRQEHAKKKCQTASNIYLGTYARRSCSRRHATTLDRTFKTQEGLTRGENRHETRTRQTRWVVPQGAPSLTVQPTRLETEGVSSFQNVFAAVSTSTKHGYTCNSN